MRYARVHMPDGKVRFAQVHDSTVTPLSAAPWMGGVPCGSDALLADASFLVPVAPSKIVGVGRNYREHIIEMGYEMPTLPTAFLKPPSALIGPDENVVLPPRRVSTQVEHEAELAIVIGREASRVPVSRAQEFIFGYTCANDVSARDLQRNDATLARGKGWDTFCPVGPWIETESHPDEGMNVECFVNGDLRQIGSTSDMVFGVADIVAYVSTFMTLFPGDLILTGSPGGTGSLQAGDQVDIRIEGIGSLRHGVSADPGDAQTPTRGGWL